MTRKWDFIRAPYWDPDPNLDLGANAFRAKVRAEQEAFEELLEDGWEPISASKDGWWGDRSLVWLRKPL